MGKSPSHGASPSLGELVRALGCYKSHLTGVVDRLARRGLVRREADPYDRRIRRLARTEQGEALGEEMEASITERVAECCVEQRLNNRPRRTLNWQTPAQAFAAALEP